MSRAIVDQQIEEMLKKKAEGYVYAEVGMIFFGNTWSIMRDYYVALKGVIYIIEDGKLNPSKDTFFNLTTNCIRIGRYNPKHKYQRSTRSYNYKQVKRLL
jgi:hypothetical protein